MTDCTHESITFSALGRRSVVADFDGGTITSDAGALLLREADLSLGLCAAISDCINDPRDPSKIVHEQVTMIRQRVLGIGAGYEDLNDHNTLRKDPLFQTLGGVGQDLASSPTLCRLENRIDRAALVRIAGVLVDTFIASFKDETPEELVLDFDSTDDPIHGKQEGRFFHGYYDQYCFLPLYVTCGSQLLAAYLRPSNIDGAKHSWVILSLLVKRLRQAWPSVRLTIRADSGFCRWVMLRWCDNNNVKYIIGLAKNPKLIAMSSQWLIAAEEASKKENKAQRVFAEVEYQAGTWDKARRVLVKAEHLSDKSNPRYVVTNLEGDPKALYEDLYCARGDMENRIKEQQLGLYADRTSCHDFLANQFRVMLSAAAYVLFDHVRRVGLKGTEHEASQVTTMRLKLCKIGARVSTSVRRVVLHMSSAYPYAKLFMEAVNKLMAWKDSTLKRATPAIMPAT
jgi:hypothetical protein